MSNIDPDTVEGFGDEWSRFDQSGLSKSELVEWGNRYFSILPLESLNKSMKAMDVGCGSGRWSTLVAPLVGEIHLVDASGRALEVARRNLWRFPNAIFHQASVDQLPVRDGSMDLIYSLGVFHQVPDVSAAVTNCAEKLAPGGEVTLVSLLPDGVPIPLVLLAVEGVGPCTEVSISTPVYCQEASGRLHCGARMLVGFADQPDCIVYWNKRFDISSVDLSKIFSLSASD